MNHFFKRPAKNQNDDNDRRSEQNDGPSADAACGADARGQPDASGRGETVDVFALVAADNNAGAQKSDSGHNALDDAARVSATGLRDRKDD